LTETFAWDRLSSIQEGGDGFISTVEMSERPVAGSPEQPRPDPTRAGTHFLESLDRRLHNESGSDDDGLLTALGDYLDAREALAGKKKDEEETPQKADIAWIWTLVAGVFILGALIPDTFFTEIRYKEYGEKLITYLAGAGLLTKWVRSPKNLIEASRKKWFRVVAGGLLGTGALLSVKVFTIHAAVVPQPTEVYLDGGSKPLEKRTFGTRLKSLNVELRKPGTARSRIIRISALDLLRHASWKQGELFIDQQWRMDYEILLECKDGSCFPPVTLVFSLRESAFDDAFEEYLTEKDLRWHKKPSNFELDFNRPRDVTMALLPGTYDVQAVKKGCDTQALDSLTVGPDSERSYPTIMMGCGK
jgi:hypothetical protein